MDKAYRESVMRKLTRIILLILPLGFLFVGSGAEAQSRPICAPVTTPVVTTDFLGAGSLLPADPTGGAPEICIHIYETEGPGEYRFRGPIPLPLPTPLAPFEYAFTPITGVVGDYTVFPMLISYAPSPVPPGFVITMAGVVTRTAMTNPIPNTLVMNVLVGWNTGVPVPIILDLVLDITPGGPSVTYLWGAPLYPNGSTPLDDVRIRGGLPPIEFTSFGDEAPITLQLVDIPAFYPGQTAVGFSSGASFQINNVGDATIIPTGAGIRSLGSLPSIAPAGSAPFTAPKGPHYQCYKVEKHAPRPDELTIWVALEDQFGNTEQKLGEIVRICTPVSKNGEGFDGHPTTSTDTTTPESRPIISPASQSVPASSPATPQDDEEGFPEIHLVCYKIVEGEKLNKDVLMTNQFGLATEKIKQPKELCVPSYKKVLEKEEYQEEPPTEDADPSAFLGFDFPAVVFFFIAFAVAVILAFRLARKRLSRPKSQK